MPSKHDKGLCCFFGCHRKAAIRYATPGHNLKENEEQLYCQSHWNENIKGRALFNQERVTVIGQKESK